MNRIFFVCPDINVPSGGIKQIYRQVDILNNNGFDAYIIHENLGFRCTWFENVTKVVYNSQLFDELNGKNNISGKNIFFKTIVKQFLQLPKTIKKAINKSKNIIINNNDILVFSEVYGPNICEIRKGIKKVIYNQGCYQTFFRYELDLNKNTTPYLNDDLIATIVNSEDAYNYIQYAFPKMNLYRVHYGIDEKTFNYSNQKKKQMAFMPRRLSVDLMQVINILKFRGILQNWELKPIDGLSEDKVSDLMRESAIFLSFSINEGFGMPPAEAMACGCIAVGYHGKGGKEYFKEEFSYPIQDRDVQAFAKCLEKVLLAYEENESFFLEKGKLASEFILREYAMEVENQDIVSVWTKILN